MTGLAPEPVDRAIARILASGLPDTPLDIARDLTALLSRASASGITVSQLPDGERAIHIVERRDGTGSVHTVRYHPESGSWAYNLDPDDL